MEMTLRWYGSKFDTVTLEQIRQIPGVTGVITTLYDTAPGEVWSRERIAALKRKLPPQDFILPVSESVNVHDAIKTGAPDRDLYIDHYIETLENLGKEDIHLVCYNFMPVFDWTRTELARKRPDGSTVLAYTQEAVDASIRRKCSSPSPGIPTAASCRAGSRSAWRTSKSFLPCTRTLTMKNCLPT